MKTAVHRNVGPRSIPQDVRNLRQSVFDYHETMGFPVVHKHRWTERDFREGRARQCPLHDDTYDASGYDSVCFGTGYVGGFDDGQIVYVSIADTPTNVIRVLPEGILSFDQSPQMTAPWLPEMQDGDLIIFADFAPGTWDIIDLHERYELREVAPITMRGREFSRSTPSARLRVKQEAQLEKLPYSHPLYEVPIVFDYAKVPPDKTPPGEDEPEVGTYTSFDIGVRVRGTEQLRSSYDVRDVRVKVAGDNTETTRDARVTGKSKGTSFPPGF